jgi:quinol-cytochrome oxidoreductase complex cytochrome b subunit
MRGATQHKGASASVLRLLIHLHPRAVPEEALRLTVTMGLGGAATVLFLLLGVTGGLLLAAYDPSPERAYGSVRQLIEDAPFGALFRNAHHWAGNGLLLVTFLHLLRVFFRGAYLHARQGNWQVGLALLLLVMASAFTGYLLPWDQIAYWAVTVCTGMLHYVPLVGDALLRAARGGNEVGPATLSRFFVLHVAILPLLLLGLLPLHFWGVRKAGGVLLPPPTRRGEAIAPKLVPAVPHLVLREGVVALVALAAVLILAATADAPLLAEANPGVSPNPAKAPWYFLGLQELLIHVHPALATVVVPLMTSAWLVLLPTWSREETPSGQWFHSRRGAWLALAGGAAGLVLAVLWVGLDESARPAVRSSASPLLLAVLVVVGAPLLLRWRFRLSRLESTQVAFAFLLVAFLALTATGVLFRGPGMALVWRGTP